VSKTVLVAQATDDEAVLPERVQEALGELVRAAKEGLLALSVSVGLGVLSELLEEEVDQIVGPKGSWNPDRTAVRHGHEDGEVTLGGRRVQVKRPRARTADGESEVPLASYEHVADRDQLGVVVLERMLAGVSTRKYRRAQEPVGEEVKARERSTSKSAVSRAFVERTREALWALMSRPLADMRLAVMMIDGIELHGRMNIVALGISTEGDKLALGLWEGSSENATVAAALLSDLVDRGLDVEQGLLFIIDGSKALRKAIRQVFGDDVPVQRCVRHKERNVIEHLPERDRDAVTLRLRNAWKETDHDRALEQLTTLGDRARPRAPRRRRVTPRRPGGDADRDPARDHRQAQSNVAVDQPDRVDDRHRPRHPPQRQALELRRDEHALDRRRDARSRNPVPQSPGLPRPRHHRYRDRTRPPPPPSPPRAGGHHNRHCVTITPGPPPLKLPRRAGQAPVARCCSAGERERSRS
jgi:putative transposase